MAEVDNANNDQNSKLKQQFELLLESFLSKNSRERCYLGLIFQQGKRTMLQINITARDLPNLLQAKPATANNPESGKDRPEISGHADEIKQYILERVSQEKPWILGTLTTNVAPERITVIELGRGMCIVVIPQEVKLDLTDGQHRKKAIDELISSGYTNLLSNDNFPITIILEDNFKQCKLDFGDLAKAKPVDKSLLLSFGESYGKIGITQNLIETVSMFRGKTDKINKAPKKRDKLIYTTNYIARAVSCAFGDNAEDDLEKHDVEKSSEALANCLNQFFSEHSQTKRIAEEKIERLTIDEISDFRNECLLGVSVGLEILGRLLYCAYDPKMNSFDRKKVSRLAQLDWSRDNNLWHNNVVRVNPKQKNSTKTIAWGASAIGDAVKAAKAELGWI